MNNINLYLNCPELLQDLLSLYASALLGQIFLFQILQRDGPLSLSIYTGTRKILSIFLSIFWFEKSITDLQKVSLVLGVCIMGLELFDKGGAATTPAQEKSKKVEQESFNSKTSKTTAGEDEESSESDDLEDTTTSKDKKK